MSIRVAIVEDDLSVRENLATLIEAAPGFSCVAGCATAEEAWEKLASLVPDVVLMDIHLPGRSGIVCVEKLRKLLPRIQVIMLTIEEDGERIFESLKAGATGYLVKHATPEEILAAIAEVYRGGAPMSAGVARKVVTAFRQPALENASDLQLSEREDEVLRLLARGHRSKEIAGELGIGVGTVNTYVRHIYEKLHVRTRAEAVAKLKKI
ncbi:MAG TPA: response regulator transcription factor [Verrucomicrobiae bacterium]|jgi:DNA-binding NarL/FixJ family response regulator